jgi:hypothetical protein
VLTFHTLPVNGFNSLTLSPVIVRVTDVSGNLISGDTSSITLAIRTGPIGPELSGTLTKSAVGGEAIFSDLSLSLPGSYTFTATSSGLTEGNSASFDISALDASLLDERGNRAFIREIQASQGPALWRIGFVGNSLCPKFGSWHAYWNQQHSVRFLQ